jgi:hypothetical protein
MWSLVIPAETYAAVTPSDSADLAQPCRALYLGAAGDVKVLSLEGETVIWKNLAAGIVHPIRCSRIYATDTTAGDIVAVY